MSNPLDVLQRIRAGGPPPQPVERCDLCAEPIAPEHGHVVHLDQRSLLCSCRGCWLLFTADGAGGGRYRAVPERYVSIGPLAVEPGAWEELQIPISVAFFLRSSATGSVTALYPSPAGATESLLPLDAWDRLAAANPALRSMAPDVEALLVRRDDHHDEAHLVPIDACYALVGELRRTWKGFDGGAEAKLAIDRCFEQLRERGA